MNNNCKILRQFGNLYACKYKKELFFSIEKNIFSIVADSDFQISYNDNFSLNIHQTLLYFLMNNKIDRLMVGSKGIMKDL